MQFTIITAIVVAIAGVLFATQNNVPVTVNFLLWRFDSSLAMVLLLAMFAGAIIVAVLTTPATLRSQWLLGRQKRRMEELEQERTGHIERIAELERHLAAASPAMAQERPYVGLKTLVAGGRGSDAKSSGSEP